VSPGMTETIKRTGLCSAVKPTRRCSATGGGFDAEAGRLVGRRHPDDDFVDVVRLLIARFLEDVLTGGVVGCG